MNGVGYILGPDGVREEALAEAVSAKADARFVWLHLDATDADAVAWLHDGSGLAETVVNALIATETRPRYEPIGEGALINLRGSAAAGHVMSDSLASIRLWIERGRVISVTRYAISALPPLVEAMKAGQLTDPGDLVSTLATRITEELDPEVADLGDILDDCELMLDGNRAFTLRRTIATARADAIGYRRFVVPQRQALEKLAALDCTWFDERDRLHLAEAADRFARMGEELESVRERAALMHEQITDLRAEIIDTRALLISIVALIFLPLTFLTGLLGMNVKGIPYAHEPWAFWGVVAVCVAIGVAVGGYFLRRHWFRR